MVYFFAREAVACLFFGIVPQELEVSAREFHQGIQRFNQNAFKYDYVMQIARMSKNGGKTCSYSSIFET